MAEPLQEEKRREIFRALVELQDEGFASELSRSQIAIQFQIEVGEVQNIEREGIHNEWPPL